MQNNHHMLWLQAQVLGLLLMDESYQIKNMENIIKIVEESHGQYFYFEGKLPPNLLVLIPKLQLRVKVSSFAVHSDLILHLTISDYDSRELAFFTDYWLNRSTLNCSYNALHLQSYISQNLVIVLILPFKLSNKLFCLPNGLEFLFVIFGR